VGDVVALLCEEPGEGAVEVELDAPAELLDQLDAVAHRLLATTRRAREDAIRRT
jgi:hypothetical protein